MNAKTYAELWHAQTLHCDPSAYDTLNNQGKLRSSKRSMIFETDLDIS